MECDEEDGEWAVRDSDAALAVGHQIRHAELGVAAARMAAEVAESHPCRAEQAQVLVQALAKCLLSTGQRGATHRKLTTRVVAMMFEAAWLYEVFVLLAGDC